MTGFKGRFRRISKNSCSGFLKNSKIMRARNRQNKNRRVHIFFQIEFPRLSVLIGLIEFFAEKEYEKVLKIGLFFEEKIAFPPENVWKFRKVLRNFCLGRGLRYLILWVEIVVLSLYCGVGFGVVLE
ncbi:MAG: hypothetical protein PHF18_04085 [Methanosarcina sp.]|uniref:hypothetical protein n=1 Tax=Methanosarcina sp. TaxID=2213 RepID=UPI0026217B54|nr:hypothetical protein [Methanosarcina sp.]MDD3246029.1 hypothetical protein [Methanosarcina sp.]